MNGLLKSSPTFRLFGLPSFWQGVGSLVDLGGTCEPFKIGETPDDVDVEALRSDWLAVGLDMNDALSIIKRELP